MIFLDEGSLFANHYQLKKKLGAGSFGEVWLARNLLADLDVAIKIYSLVDESGFNDFREEFKIAYKLNHPNLLHINHFDVFDQHPFLVMPYCKNGSAVNFIGKLSEKQIWQFIRDVSCGLMYLHSQNPLIIHQDIKPGNILIADNGRYMISDFGISKKIRHTIHRNNSREMSSGTLAYMGPEHFSETPHIVATSDIWSLGMSVVELMTGDVLWGGMGGSVLHNGGRMPSLTDKCSHELEGLIHKCLSVETWDRPSAKYVYEYSCQIIDKHKKSNPVDRVPINPAPVKESGPTNKSKDGIVPEFIKKHKTYILSISSALLIFCFLIVELIGYINKVEEQNALFKCVTLTDYYTFLKNYPSSYFKEQALEEIAKLKQDSISNQAKSFIEQNSDTAKDTLNTEVIEPKIAEEKRISKTNIKIKVDDKKTKESSEDIYLKNEQKIFYSCRTITDYMRYLQKYPKGRFVHDAKKAIRKLESEKMDQKPEIQISYGEEHYILH